MNFHPSNALGSGQVIFQSNFVALEHSKQIDLSWPLHDSWPQQYAMHYTQVEGFSNQIWWPQGISKLLLWNHLPMYIRNATSVGTFKRMLKTHLFWLVVSTLFRCFSFLLLLFFFLRFVTFGKGAV